MALQPITITESTFMSDPYVCGWCGEPYSDQYDAQACLDDQDAYWEQVKEAEARQWSRMYDSTDSEHTYCAGCDEVDACFCTPDTFEEGKEAKLDNTHP